MPFIINLNPSAASWYLHSLTARDGAIAVGGSGGCQENALRFDSSHIAGTIALALRGWPDARVEEVAAPAVPAADPAHFTRTLTADHAHDLAIVYATKAEHAARDCRERVVSGLSPNESIEDAVTALRDQGNTIDIARALVTMAKPITVTTAAAWDDEICCDYRSSTLHIGKNRAAEFSRLMAATEESLPLYRLLDLARHHGG